MLRNTIQIQVEGEKSWYSRWGFHKDAMVQRMQTAIAFPLSHANHEPKRYFPLAE
jgi:hypothetical protein